LERHCIISSLRNRFATRETKYKIDKPILLTCKNRACPNDGKQAESQAKQRHGAMLVVGVVCCDCFRNFTRERDDDEEELERNFLKIDSFDCIGNCVGL
jgi:hypothetical protein